jgi:SAM-dependent MidA family methyltransferase
VNRYLRQEKLPPRLLWENVKDQVQSFADGFIVFEDNHSDPYINIGQQDVTADVDFTALERQGERCGLQTVGFTQQGLFLMALGLGDRVAALSDPTQTEHQSVNDILRRRDALHSLMNPMGLGNFGVLIQSKGLGIDQDISQHSKLLKGLSTPFN